MAEITLGPRGAPRWRRFLKNIGESTPRGAPLIADFILPVDQVPIVSESAIGGGSVAALAANRSLIQLLNPAANNYDLWVRYIGVQITAAALILLRHFDTALGTPITATRQMLNMWGGERDTSATMHSDQGTAVGTTLAFMPVRDLFSELHFDRGAFIMQPGQGILTAPNADNIGIHTTYIWEEVPRQ